MYIFLKKFKTIAVHQPVIKLCKSGAAIVILMFTFTIVFSLVEKVNWVEGLWQAWQTFTTVGYGNRPAGTDTGKLLTILIGTIGIAVMAVFISVVSDLKHYFRERRRLGFMKNPHKSGYVIINFPGLPESLKLIEQIRHVEEDVPVCFVDSDLEFLPPSIQALPKTHFVRGRLSDHKTFELAALEQNKSVLVYPDNPNSENADLNTKAVVDLVCNYFKGPTVSVLYVLCESRNAWLFPKSATAILKNLWILSLVQEFQSQSAGVIEKLLTNNDNQSINVLEVTKSGLTWSDVVLISLHLGDLNPIALLKEGAKEPLLTVAPKVQVRSGDKVYFACSNDRDLNKLQSYLFDAKNKLVERAYSKIQPQPAV